MISQLVVDWMQLRYVKDEINIKEMVKLSYKYLLAAIIMFVVCNLTKLIISTGMLSIILQVGVGIVVYGIVLIILKDEYLYMFLNKLREKFIGKLAK